MKRTTSSLILVLVTLATATLATPAAADPGGFQNPDLPSAGGNEPAWSGDSKDLLVQSHQPVWSGDSKDLRVQSLGSSQPTPAGTVEVADDSFQFGDALIGALVASGLVLMALAVGRPVARHRRQTAASRA